MKRRLLSLVAALVLLALVLPALASAFEEWCDLDPAVPVKTTWGDTIVFYVANSGPADHRGDLVNGKRSSVVTPVTVNVDDIAITVSFNDADGHAHGIVSEVWTGPQRGGSRLSSLPATMGTPVIHTFRLTRYPDTATPTATRTPTPMATQTSTHTPAATSTPTVSATPTVEPTATPTAGPSASATAAEPPANATATATAAAPLEPTATGEIPTASATAAGTIEPTAYPPQPTYTPAPTYTPYPTSTPYPIQPTYTPAPTYTAYPTSTAYATVGPPPPLPSTPTPEPAAALV